MFYWVRNSVLSFPGDQTIIIFSNILFCNPYGLQLHSIPKFHGINPTVWSKISPKGKVLLVNKGNKCLRLLTAYYEQNNKLNHENKIKIKIKNKKK